MGEGAETVRAGTRGVELLPCFGRGRLPVSRSSLPRTAFSMIRTDVRVKTELRVRECARSGRRSRPLSTGARTSGHEITLVRAVLLSVTLCNWPRSWPIGQPALKGTRAAAEPGLLARAARTAPGKTTGCSWPTLIQCIRGDPAPRGACVTRSTTTTHEVLRLTPDDPRDEASASAADGPRTPAAAAGAPADERLIAGRYRVERRLGGGGMAEVF